MNRVAYLGDLELYNDIKSFLPEDIIFIYYGEKQALKNQKIDLLIYSVEDYDEGNLFSTEYREYLGLTHMSIFYIVDNREKRRFNLENSLDDYIVKPFLPEYFLSRINIRLEMKVLSDKVRYMIREQVSILDLSEIFSSNFSYQRSLSILVKKLSKIFKTDLLTILLIENDSYKVVANAKKEFEEFESVNLIPERYPEIQEALRTRKIVYLEVEKYEELGKYKNLILEKGIKSILVLPITYQNRVLGAISVKFLKSRYNFYKNIINYSMIITNTTAIALKNAEMLENIQKENNDLIKNQELAKFSHLYTEVLNKAGIPMLVIDKRGEMVYLNTHIAKIFSYEYSKLLKSNFFSFIVKDENREYIKNRINRLKRNESFSYSLSIRLLFEAPIWLGLRISYFKQNFYTIEFDISEKYKKEQKKLEYDIGFYQNIIDLSDNAYIGVKNGNIKMFNKGAQKVLGYSKEEAMYLKVWDIYPTLKMAKDVSKAIYKNNGRVKNYETILLSKFNNEIIVKLDAFFLYDENGKKIGSAGIFKP